MNDMFDGVKESQIISEQIIEKMINIFSNLFDTKRYSLYTWGSLSRREAGPYSDLDIIILCDEVDMCLINKFEILITENFPNNELDLLRVYTIDELKKISKVDGTDMQAYLFKRLEIGEEKDLLTTKYENINRELFHILYNLEFSYSNLFGSDNLKFSKYFLKYYNFSTLLAAYLGCDDCCTIASIKYLYDNNVISKKLCKICTNTFKQLLFLRNRTQEFNQNCNSIITLSFSEDFSDNFNISEFEIKEILYAISDMGKQLYLSIQTFMFSIFKNIDVELIKECFLEKETDFDSKIFNRIIKSENEIMLMLLAYFSKKDMQLEKLRKNNYFNWYIVYGIANNIHSSSDTLFNLINSSSFKSKNVVELYNSFEWRNIYLYVAKNHSSDYRVRHYILNYSGSRKMDIIAANMIAKN